MNTSWYHKVPCITSTRTHGNRHTSLIALFLFVNRMERQKYYKHALKAKSASHQYMSLIVDAMDTSKTNLPHLLHETTESTASKLGVHVVGAISHGRDTYAYVDVDEYPHSSNLIMTTILSILQSMDTLPPVLYLQLVGIIYIFK